MWWGNSKFNSKFDGVRARAGRNISCRNARYNGHRIPSPFYLPGVRAVPDPVYAYLMDILSIFRAVGPLFCAPSRHVFGMCREHPRHCAALVRPERNRWEGLLAIMSINARFWTLA